MGDPQIQNLTSDEAGVEAAGDTGVGSAFNDGASVGKDGHLIRVTPELENEVIVPHAAVWGETQGEKLEIHGAMLLVNLDRVAAAEGDVRAAFAGKMRELATVAAAAAFTRTSGGDLGVLVGPNVPGEQGAAELGAGSDQQLDRFGGGEGSHQVDRAVQDARGVAGFDQARRRVGKDAGEAGSFAGEDVHRYAVTADGGGVDPGDRGGDSEVVEKITGLEVVGAIQDELNAGEQLGNVSGREVRDDAFGVNVGV